MLSRLKQVNIAALPLPLYLLGIVLASACVLTDSLPGNMVGALFFLILLVCTTATMKYSNRNVNYDS